LGERKWLPWRRRPPPSARRPDRVAKDHHRHESAVP
jgi:hypothetical protein